MTLTVTPGEDWQLALGRLQAGGELLLAPGDYTGGWVIRRGGTPAAPIVIGALDAERPPRISPARGRNIVLEVDADDVVVRGLSFAPTPTDVHAVTLHGASRIIIEDCRFEGIGGLAIAETMTARRIVVRRNHIRHSRTTAMYFGCHSGSCSISDLLIEDNHIEVVTAPRRAVGYGIQVKLDSSATIRRNVVVDTKGPGIMVYGARHPGLVNCVEQNFVARSRRSSGIVVGGGPAIVRGNTAVGNAEAGIALEDYERRGLLHAIEVTANTVYDNGLGGIAVPAGTVDAKIGPNVTARPTDAARPA